ncbi:hypothetical protein ABTX61_17890 [Amycolatopsis japonica]|uniref:DUF6928 family protein n=1 Tax=Amycolatopsis japonica TaxID=208439 RepID=UPI0033339179
MICVNAHIALHGKFVSNVRAERLEVVDGIKVGYLGFADVNSAGSLKEISSQGWADSKILAEKLFGRVAPGVRSLPLDLGIWPGPGVVCASSAVGLQAICSREFIVRNPSQLTSLIEELARGKDSYAVFMDSAEDWTAFAVWSCGRLKRSLSIDPGSGVVEDLGDRLAFEEPFWNGGNAVRESADYPLPFHPGDLGNEALREFFGFILEGREDDRCFDPEEVKIWEFEILHEDCVQLRIGE